MKRLNDIDSFEIEDHKNPILPIKVFDTFMLNNDSFFRHWHKEFEMTLVFSGKGVYELNLVDYIVEEGDLIIIENEMLHYGYGLYDGIKGTTIVFDMEMFHSVLQDSIDTKYILPIISGYIEFQPIIKNAVKENPWLKDRFIQLSILYEKREQGFELQLKACILEILALIISRQYFSTPNLKVKQNDSAINAIKAIIKYIDGNLNSEIYLHTLAQIANFEKSYMSRFFKKHLGMTCTDYITRRRLNRATQLLVSTELSISEVAYETGFTNVSFFLKKFKERYGLTPKKYRTLNLSE